MKIEYGIENYLASAIFDTKIDRNLSGEIKCISAHGSMPKPPSVISGGLVRTICAGDVIDIRAEKNENEISLTARALQIHRSNLRSL